MPASIIQNGNIFHLPVELALEIEDGLVRKKIWLDSNHTDFEFITSFKPEKLTVDPDFLIPAIRWMPPRLVMLWDKYPDLNIIYGSAFEAEADFNSSYVIYDNHTKLSSGNWEDTESDLIWIFR